MAASFPPAKKTFSQLVDGTTKMEGINVNTIYDEVEAIETFVGAMGVAQANCASLRALLTKYIEGCEVSYKDNNELYIAAGEISIPDTAGNLTYRRNTAVLTVDWGDIDTGAAAGGNTYYVYAVGDGAASTFTAKVSLNATAPAATSFYRRVGSFYNDPSSGMFSPSFSNDNKIRRINAVFDSGWFAIAVSTNYTLQHQLGTIKVLAMPFFAKGSAGENCNPLQENDLFSSKGAMVFNLSTTTVGFQTFGTIDVWNGAAQSATHARLILVALV